MNYRVSAQLAFTEEDEANDFYHDCELALAKSQTINQGTEASEQGFICLEKCWHDENLSEPCLVLKNDYTPP